MADSNAHREWMKENTVVFSIRLQKKTDADILNFLQGQQRQTVIKAALREYMERHGNE